MDSIRTQWVDVEAQVFIRVLQYLMLPTQELIDRREDVMFFSNTIAQDAGRGTVAEQTDPDSCLLLLVDRIQL